MIGLRLSVPLQPNMTASGVVGRDVFRFIEAASNVGFCVDCACKRTAAAIAAKPVIRTQAVVSRIGSMPPESILLVNWTYLKQGRLATFPVFHEESTPSSAKK
jgi:hypothetical protein